jgi:hypothetical protein
MISLSTIRALSALVPPCFLLLVAAGCESVEPGKTQPAQAPIEPPRSYACSWTPAPPTIDGRLTDAAWQAAQWTDDFVDIEGDLRPRPLYQTRAKLLWDDVNLYIGAELADPHVWGTLTEHDAIVFHDPDFEIFIDPDGDRAAYYEIEVNALNTIFDLFLVRTYIDGGPALHGWDCKGLHSAVHVDGTLNDPRDFDRGWSVEFAIPWSALAEAAGTPAPPQPGDVWRMNFSRVQWPVETEEGRYVKVPGQREDNWVWSPQGKINMHLPEHWGNVEFVGGKAR